VPFGFSMHRPACGLRESLGSLAPYVPFRVLQSVLSQPDCTPSDSLASLARIEDLPAAVAAIDVCGLVALCERLTKQGDGMEKFSAFSDQFFSKLLTTLSHFGGDVEALVGERLIVVFRAESDSDEALKAACGRAVHSLLRLNEEFLGFAPITQHQIELRSSLNVGMTHSIGVGGPTWRASLLVGGSLNQMRAVRPLGGRGLVVSSRIWELIRGDKRLTSHTMASGDTLVQLLDKATSHELDPERLPSEEFPQKSEPHAITRAESLLPAFILDAARQQQQAPERRTVSVGMCNFTFPGLDDGRPTPEATAELQRVVAAASCLIHSVDGRIRQVVSTEKGLRLVFVMGLVGSSHPDNATRAVHAGLLLHKLLTGSATQVAVGISSGSAFCGTVGKTDLRCDYTVMGETVTLAEQLVAQSLKQGGSVTVCARTAELCADQVSARSLKRLLFSRLPRLHRKRKEGSEPAKPQAQEATYHPSLAGPRDLWFLARLAMRSQVQVLQTPTPLRFASAAQPPVFYPDALKEAQAALSQWNREATGGCLLVKGGVRMGKTSLLNTLCALPEEVVGCVVRVLPETELAKGQPAPTIASTLAALREFCGGCKPQVGGASSFLTGPRPYLQPAIACFPEPSEPAPSTPIPASPRTPGRKGKPVPLSLVQPWNKVTAAAAGSEHGRDLAAPLVGCSPSHSASTQSSSELGRPPKPQQRQSKQSSETLQFAADMQRLTSNPVVTAITDWGDIDEPQRQSSEAHSPQSIAVPATPSTLATSPCSLLQPSEGLTDDTPTAVSSDYARVVEETWRAVQCVQERRDTATTASTTCLSIVIDDLDRIGQGLLHLLGEMCTIPGVRILGALLTTTVNVKEVLSAATPLVLVRLNYLAPKPTVALASRLFGASPFLPDTLSNYLVDMSGGNPLLCSQICGHLVECRRVGVRHSIVQLLGDLKTELPESITAPYSPRLDALEPQTSILLQTASAIGMQFTLQVLKEVLPVENTTFQVEGALRSLCHLGLLVTLHDPNTTSPKRLIWRFANGVVHQAVYKTTPWTLRVEVHQTIARRLELAVGGRTPTKAECELVVHHLQEAVDQRRCVRGLEEDDLVVSDLERFSALLRQLGKGPASSSKPARRGPSAAPGPPSLSRRSPSHHTEAMPGFAPLSPCRFDPSPSNASPRCALITPRSALLAYAQAEGAVVYQPDWFNQDLSAETPFGTTSVYSPANCFQTVMMSPSRLQAAQQEMAQVSPQHQRGPGGLLQASDNNFDSPSAGSIFSRPFGGSQPVHNSVLLPSLGASCDTSPRTPLAGAEVHL